MMQVLGERCVHLVSGDAIAIDLQSNSYTYPQYRASTKSEVCKKSQAYT